jgi:uncharacterized repeat protein (TIGR03803 family)
MNILNSVRYVFSVCAAVAMLAGCGGSQPPIGAPGAMQQTAIAPHTERTDVHPAYSLIYSFKAAEDGQYPYASLIHINGTLYGTTFFGGGISGCMDGCGTVFAIATSGKEKVLHRFDGSRDGAYPFTGLLDVNGWLYGTAWEGGRSGRGTIYAITTSGGKSRLLHTFVGGCCDGSWPRTSLINVNGTLYGTTSMGGSTGCYEYQGCGTIFSFPKSGGETVLHSFGTGSGDGQYPEAGLLNVKGTLYGTTSEGGAYHEGTVFAMSTSASGAETILHSFGGSGDGEGPNAALINVNGTLYGTTAFGGNNTCAENSCGTVFAITTSGKETVLHSFSGAPDGFSPYAGLIDVKGTLYGTTTYGGNGGCADLGCGIVFSITPSGSETVLHTFAGYPNDGGEPEAGLLNVDGTLFGTTMSGGSTNSNHCDDGCGAVFAIKP